MTTPQRGLGVGCALPSRLSFLEPSRGCSLTPQLSAQRAPLQGGLSDLPTLSMSQHPHLPSLGLCVALMATDFFLIVVCLVPSAAPASTWHIVGAQRSAEWRPVLRSQLAGVPWGSVLGTE